jgi:hypothetical protein
LPQLNNIRCNNLDAADLSKPGKQQLLTHNHYYDADFRCYDMDFCHVRFLIEQRSYWATLSNIQANSVTHVLETYFPTPSHIFCERFAINSYECRTFALGFYRKTDIDTDGVCEAVNHLPIGRAERRRVLREIRNGRDILRLTLDDTDETLAIALLAAVGSAGPVQ